MKKKEMIKEMEFCCELSRKILNELKTAEETNCYRVIEERYIFGRYQIANEIIMLRRELNKIRRGLL